MDARLQRRVQRYGWDRAAAIYEGCWSRQLAPAQSRMLELADLAPGARVLDVACGTGLVSLRVAEAIGTAGRMVGTDISGEMVRVAREEAERRGIANAEFHQMDAEQLTLPDATFDVALCALGLMYVPDVIGALREMRRVLVPGGTAAVAVWGRRQHCGWAPIFEIIDRRVRSEVCPMFFQLGTGDALAHAFGESGFGDVVSDRLQVTLEYASADAACDAAFAGGPVALAYSRFDADQRASAREEYLESIAQWRVGAGYAMPGEFVVARARALRMM